ncbi:SIR2 family protein [Vibrio fluvialis]|uniref:SIR2 family protein n=1 Tax=Vibrio fluvialis TaxID=676 RepID=UPI002ACA37A9|nr:SIR2 family protein [Vibrio fluvialis]MDZ5515213.1 SIR2 family protein [Vibrio fluvialis]
MAFNVLEDELKHKERSIKDLVAYLKTRTSNTSPNYNLLLGAGASFTSGIRTGQHLVDEWRKDEYQMLSGENDYTADIAKKYLITEQGSWYTESNEYSSLFERKFDLASQRRRFVEKEVESAKPSIGYAYLVSLMNVSNRYFDTIYTTNFDDLINEAFYQFSQTRPLVCAHDSSVNSLSISSTRPKIIKLHGDYLFDDIKSTLRETESLEANIRNKFIEFSKEFGLVVMGYSGNDRSIMDVLNHLLKSEDYLKNGVYWCIRKGSQVSSELRKLLWKERVYFVQVDGFDEAMAELHHALNGSLSIKDNLADSKQEQIIKSIQGDTFSLATKSEYIRSDISNLMKHKNELDISNLIRELNSNDGDHNYNISESQFKSLLEIDAKAKSNNYLEAKSIAENYLANCTDSNISIRYIRKLIFICNKLDLHSDSLAYCDKLIDTDKNNHDYHIVKCENMDTLAEKCKYIKSYVENFKYISSFNNYVCRIALKEIEHSENKTFSIDEVIKLLDRSLKLNPSLDNEAWNQMLTAYGVKFINHADQKGEKERKRLVDELLERAKQINHCSVAYFELLSHPQVTKQNLDATLSCIKAMEEEYLNARKSKQRLMFDLICYEYLSLINIRKKDYSYKETWKEFFNSDIFESQSDKDKITSYCLLRANYSICVEYDLVSFKKYIDFAAKSDDAAKFSTKIYTAISNILKDLDWSVDFINSVKKDITKQQYYSLMSDVELQKSNFDKAIEYKDKEYEAGLKMEEYLCEKSFILLVSGDYLQTRALCDSHSNVTFSPTNRAILTLNNEYANHKLNKGVNKAKVRNIVGQNLGENINIACFTLLGQEPDAIRLIKQEAELDITLIENYCNWPILTLLNGFNIQDLSIIKSKESALSVA